MRPMLALIAVPLALAGCGSHHEGSVTTTATDASGNKVVSALSIDTKDFKANIEVPGLELAGGHLDLDGIKLYPGTKVHGIRVRATDAGKADSHSVAFDFVSPALPDAVADHLVKQARDEGFTVERSAGTAGGVELTGTKFKHDETNRFHFSLKPAGSETAGTATLDGKST